MGVATAVKSMGRVIGNTIEAAIIPTKVQQWYMHYQLAETTLGETNIPRPFLSQMAELADHIYLTGTRRSHAKSTYEGAHALKKELGALFQNYYQVDRFNAAGKLPPPLPPRPAHMFKLSDADIEVYVVGHSLGGAVATLCAYDLTCKRPSLNPVLVTFGSPPVGNVDFAVDYQKVMVDTNQFHPRSGYLRSVRIVAKTTGKHADIITSAPDFAPNVIHVNTKVPLDTNVEGWLSMLSAHSIANSYGQGLK